MTTDKTFDCVFITIDKQDRKTVRVANDFNKRLYVLKRDMKEILFQHDFTTAKTVDEILAYVEEACDVNDEEAVQQFAKKLSRKRQRNDKTTAQDLLAVIAARKTAEDNIVA